MPAESDRATTKLASFSRLQMDARRQLVDLARGPKRLILVLNDFLLLSFALWLALSLRLSVLYVPRSLDLAAILAAAPIIGVLTFIRMGLYRLVTRFISARGTLQILAAVAIATLCWALMVFMAGQAVTGVPRSVVIIYGVLAAFFVWASRQFAGLILKGLPNMTLASFKHERRPVAIYGAGTTGVQLLESLKRTRVYEPIGFIDENPSLWGQMVGGLKVYRPEKIGRMIERDNVREVLLAMPEATHRHRQDVIKELTRHPRDRQDTAGLRGHRRRPGAHQRPAHARRRRLAGPRPGAARTSTCCAAASQAKPCWSPAPAARSARRSHVRS